MSSQPTAVETLATLIARRFELAPLADAHACIVALVDHGIRAVNDPGGRVRCHIQECMRGALSWEYRDEARMIECCAEALAACGGATTNEACGLAAAMRERILAAA